ALVYGGLMAFLSAALPRGDATVALLLFLPTFVPQALLPLEASLPAGLYAVLLFVLPPHGALQDVYQGLLLGTVSWAGVAYALGYAAVWLALAAVIVRLREVE